MQTKQLVIFDSATSKRFVFNNKLSFVVSNELSNEIAYFDKQNHESTYVIESEDNLSFSETINIRINLKNTGIIIATFKKEKFTQGSKETLFNELMTLKDNLEPTKDSQIIKMMRVFNILKVFSPIFVSYINNGDIIITRQSLEEPISHLDISYPVLLLLVSFDFEPVPKQEKGLRIFKKIEKKPRESKPKPERVKGEKAKISIPELFNLDFAFFMIFTMFISFGSYFAIFQLINSEAIASFLLILVAVFLITLNFATYKSYKENNNFQLKLSRVWIPATYVIIGAVVGAIVGFVITKNLMTLKEDVTFDYGLMIGIIIPSTIVLGIASLCSPLLTSKIIKKLSKKSANHE